MLVLQIYGFLSKNNNFLVKYVKIFRILTRFSFNVIPFNVIPFNVIPFNVIPFNVIPGLTRNLVNRNETAPRFRVKPGMTYETPEGRMRPRKDV